MDQKKINFIEIIYLNIKKKVKNGRTDMDENLWGGSGEPGDGH